MLFILLTLALTATVISLVAGLICLFKGGAFNEKYGNQAMRWRIIFQACALILFFLILYFGQP